MVALSWFSKQWFFCWLAGPAMLEGWAVRLPWHFHGLGKLRLEIIRQFCRGDAGAAPFMMFLIINISGKHEHFSLEKVSVVDFKRPVASKEFEREI